jgi:hypothetical protein
VSRAILYADVVVLRRGAKAGEHSVNRLALLQLLQIRQFVAADLRHALQIAVYRRGEREFHRELRTRRTAVDHVEIVFVDAGFDDLGPGVLEAVLQHQLRFALSQADGLFIKIRVARSVA